ncbi:MAG: RNA recognition motif domain-containing protein [Ardenticatenaceae bacterium]
MDIYVGNLLYEIEEDELRRVFETYGEVSKVTIIYDRDSGRSKGFGFVEMRDNKEAQDAIDALDGMPIRGREARVNQARPRKPRRERREPRW